MFSIPVANADAERLLSRMKRIKIEKCCSLGARRLENIVCLTKYDPLPPTDVSFRQKACGIRELARRSYKKRECATRDTTKNSEPRPSDSDTELMRKNFSHYFYYHF